MFFITLRRCFCHPKALNDTQDVLLVQAPATPCTTSTVEGVGNGGVWPFTLRASKPRMAQARRRTGRPAGHRKGASTQGKCLNSINLDNQFGDFEGWLYNYFDNNKVLYIASNSLENEWRWWRLKRDSLHKNESKRWFTHCEPAF